MSSSVSRIAPVVQTMQERGGIFGQRLGEWLRSTQDSQLVNAAVHHFQNPWLAVVARDLAAGKPRHDIYDLHLAANNVPGPSRLRRIAARFWQLQAPVAGWDISDLALSRKLLTPLAAKSPGYATTFVGRLSTGLREEAQCAREAVAEWQRAEVRPLRELPRWGRVASFEEYTATVKLERFDNGDICAVSLADSVGRSAHRTHVYDVPADEGTHDNWWRSVEGRAGMIEFLNLRAANLDAAATFAQEQGAQLAAGLAA